FQKEGSYVLTEPIAEGAPDSRANATLKRVIDIVLWVLMATLVYSGWTMRTQYPDLPFADQDTIGYLLPALTWADGTGFCQVHGRGWLYPAFLHGVLEWGGDFQWIARVQKVIGLAGAVVFWFAF